MTRDSKLCPTCHKEGRHRQGCPVESNPCAKCKGMGKANGSKCKHCEGHGFKDHEVTNEQASVEGVHQTIERRLYKKAYQLIEQAKRKLAEGLISEGKGVDWQVNGWIQQYQGSTFEWTSGRHKGMTFTISDGGHELSGPDPHVRGYYEKHPEFGDITDIHQLLALLEDITTGKVKVTDEHTNDITSKAKRDAQALANHLEDQYDEDQYDDEEQDDEIIESKKSKKMPAFLKKKWGIKEEELEERNFDRGVGRNGVDRDKLPDSDFAGRVKGVKTRSFPIVVPQDVADAVRALSLAGSKNLPKSAIKANIIKIAKRKGKAFVAKIPKSWLKKEE